MTIAERQELKTGTSLSLDGRKCMILEVMGAGTSCIAYKAQMELTIEGKTASRTIVLKELYPSHQNIIREKDNSLIIPANFQTAFEEESKSFVEAAILQFEFHNEEELTNFTSDIEIVYKLNNTLYSITGIVSGKSYDKINPENITSILKVGESLSYAISYYHRKNYLNLDIKPLNIFYENLPGDNVAIKLFDFNTVCTKEEALQGKFSYSEGYAAPEVKAAKKGGGNFSDVGEQADIYSIGAVIFEKIIGRIPKVADQRKGKKWKLETNPYLKEVTPQLQNGITELFRKTLAIDNKDRYSSVKELIKDLDKLIELASIKVFLKSQNISPCTAKNIYIPRKKACNIIYERLNQYHILYIHAIHGSGKSETAREYAETYSNKYNFIQLAFYSQSLKKTIANLDFIGLKYEDKIAKTDDDIDRLYSYKLDLLSNSDIYTSNTLLIIDNYDYGEHDSEECKQNVKVLSDLKKLHIHIIFTTIENPDDKAHCFKLEDMSRTELEQLFFKINPVQKDNPERIKLVDEIIKVSYNHTMLVKLVALQFKKYKKSLEEYLYKLKEHGINSHIQGRITNEKDDETTISDAVYELIKDLFQSDLDNLSNKEKYVMVNACLLPFEGLNIVTFSDFIDLDNFYGSSNDCIDESIENMVNSGWINYTDSYETQISLHPLIREVVANELIPEITDNKCRKIYIHFLDLISEWGNKKTKQANDCQEDENLIYLLFRNINGLIGYDLSEIINYIQVESQNISIENYTLISNDILINYFGADEIYYIGKNIKIIRHEAFENCFLLKEINIPDSVVKIEDYAFADCAGLQKVNIPSSVTSIGTGVFEGCLSLQTISLPNSIKDIGSYAFAGCTSLTGITMPDSIQDIKFWTFAGCVSLEMIKIPETVVEIGYEAFYACSSLKSIVIPDSVKKIGNFAFRDCTSLINLKIPPNIPSPGHNTFEGCPVFGKVPNTLIKEKIIPHDVYCIEDFAFQNFISLEKIQLHENITKIGDCAFYNCFSLTQISIPENVTHIGDGAFEYCSALTQANIPSGITILGKAIFQCCTSLPQIYIPDSVKKIDNNVFYRCYSLTKVTIPDSVVDIGNNVFYGCINLTQIIIPNSVRNIGYFSFAYCWELRQIDIPYGIVSIGKSIFEECHKLEKIFLPDSITYIGDSAFEGCIGLKEVKLPKNITYIGNSVFESCHSLQQIILPNSISSIGKGAFWECSSLTQINIPDSVISIDSRAFGECSSLLEVIIPENVQYIGEEAFLYKNLRKIKILNPEVNIEESKIGYHKDSYGLYRKNETLTVEGYKGSTAEEYAN